MLKRIIHLALVGIIGFLFLVPTYPIHAQDPVPFPFFVNSPLDLPDFVHNSVCSAGAVTGGPCTLRAAVDEANKCPDDAGACEAGAIIHIPAGVYTLSLPGIDENQNATGDLDINSNEGIQIIIEGDPLNSPIIDANGIDRVLHILFNSLNSNVTLRNLVIQGGHLEINTLAGQTYQVGGGIANSGNLTLENVVIQDNQLTCVSTSDTNCYQAIGGGLFNSGVFSMNMSSIRNNLAVRGGGIFHNNTNTMSQIFHSTISGNQASQSGGGLETYGQLSFINSTISNNSALFYGGIVNENSGNLSLMNVTVANNTSSNSGAANLANYGDVTIMNSIITYPGSFPGAVNCHNGGSWSMGGGNLYSDGSCPAGPGVISNMDPRLSPLAWLGGPTMTRGLLPGSPAHNAYAGFCQDESGFTVSIDQRGLNRDNQCDLGAFEGIAYSLFTPLIRR